mmetsp:Transcript_4636/g.10126  ORF Transcript_4636/g.10126 Transcript_4636/m.10126 type:complete len:176 (-) Transcript_4636:73-600(-)
MGLSPYAVGMAEDDEPAQGLDDTMATDASVSRVLYGFRSPHETSDVNAEASGFPRRPLSAYSQGGALSARTYTSTLPSARSTSRPTSAPVSRMKQLGEVERIKLSFAHRKIVCPMATIEKGVLVPEDKSYASCLTSLPTAGTQLRLSNPFQKTGKKGKKGKGKKGKDTQAQFTRW